MTSRTASFTPQVVGNFELASVDGFPNCKACPEVVQMRFVRGASTARRLVSFCAVCYVSLTGNFVPMGIHAALWAISQMGVPSVRPHSHARA